MSKLKTCDTSSRPLNVAKAKGKPVRLYLNLNNGCFVVASAGKVLGYAAGVRLTNVTPKISAAGYERCKRERVRNVHAYLCGAYKGPATKPPTGKGWRKISYNCVQRGPHFTYVDAGSIFSSAAEVVAIKRGTKAEVYARGSAKKKNPGEGCRCGAPNGLCRCGAAQAWWKEEPPGCGCPQRNPFEPRNLGDRYSPQGVPVPPAAKARLDALADEWHKLATQIDLAYVTGDLFKVADLEERAETVLAELEAASDELVTSPTEPGSIHEETNIGLEDFLARSYAQFLGQGVGYDRFAVGPDGPQTREGVFCEVVRMAAPGRIMAHAGPHLDLKNVTDAQIMEAAKDAYWRKADLIDQLRGPKRWPHKGNPVKKKVRPCGNKPEKVGIHAAHGATLVLDLHNVKVYGREEIARYGFCPLLAGFRQGKRRIARKGQEKHLNRKGKSKELAALARRLGVPLGRLVRDLIHEGIAWYEAKSPAAAKNPSGPVRRRDDWTPPEPRPDDCIRRFNEWTRANEWEIGTEVAPESSMEMAVLDQFHGGYVHSTPELISNLSRYYSQASVRRAVKNLIRDGYLEKVEHSQLGGHRAARIVRARTAFFRATGKGEQRICLNRVKYHQAAIQAATYDTDEEIEAAYMKHLEREEESARVASERAAEFAPPGVEIRAFDFGSFTELRAQRGGEWVGMIRVLSGPGDDRHFTGIGRTYAAVSGFAVHPSEPPETHKALYQAAALHARDNLGLPLASNVHRGLEEAAFWADQQAKEAARLHYYGGARGERFTRFALNEPVPDRLPNPRRKRDDSQYVLRSTCPIPGYTVEGQGRTKNYYVTAYNPNTGAFSFTSYRQQATPFVGLDTAEIVVGEIEERLSDRAGRPVRLEIQPRNGGRSIQRGCSTPGNL